MRILGTHPVETKNLRPDCPIRIIRFASETLPTDPEGGEVKNTQYPAFKKRLPPSLLKKDITIRKPVMTIKDPQGGSDIFVEFVSYNQTTQSQAGVQRFSIWCDESAPLEFYEEQRPRLLSAKEYGYGGDLIYSLTPAEFIGWEFDQLFERAEIYIRSPHVCDRVLQRTGERPRNIETTDMKTGIAVIMAATDDNPVYSKEMLDEEYSTYDDENIIDIRRYGLFKQVCSLKDLGIGLQSLDIFHTLMSLFHLNISLILMLLEMELLI